MAELVSVIIPVYNTQQWLEQCLESVLNQTYSEIEIILVDDGSEEKCSALCDDFGRRFSKIRVIHKENGGISSARNTGIQNARGKYLLFLDSDDYWDCDNAVEQLMAKVDQSPDMVCFGFKKLIEASGQVIDSFPWGKYKTQFFEMKSDIRIHYLIGKGILASSACNKFIRRDFLLHHRIFFREGVTSEDIEWTAKVLTHCSSVECLPLSFYIYRQRGGSITSSMTLKSLMLLKQNIEYSYQYGNEHLNPDSTRYKEFMAYLSYQYMTLLLSAHNVRAPEIKQLVGSMKYMVSVLNYSDNTKVKLMRMVYHCFGFRGLNMACGLYMRYLFNRI